MSTELVEEKGTLYFYLNTYLQKDVTYYVTHKIKTQTIGIKIFSS